MICIPPLTTEKTCQLCHQGPLVPFEIPGSSLLWRCDACELYQFGEFVGEEAYPIDYHFGYSKRREQKIRTAKLRLRRLAQTHEKLGMPLSKPAGLRLLEVGASVGCTLEAAESFGWQAIGVDVSEDAVDVCRKLGLAAEHVGPVTLPFPDNSFDLLVNWHVIEHVGDVRETLQEWHRVLKPGGLMMLETPDASSPKVRRLGTRYRKFWAPEHTYTFTPQNLTRFLDETGWTPQTMPLRLSMSGLTARDQFYGHMYETYMSLRKTFGIHKAFQLIAQKPLEMSPFGKTHAPSAPELISQP